MNKWKIDNKSKKCWLFHRWKTVKNTGSTMYQKCKDCDSRQILQCEGGYQPINFKWLLGKTNKA